MIQEIPRYVSFDTLIVGLLAIVLTAIGLLSRREWKWVLLVAAIILFLVAYGTSEGFFSMKDKNKILIVVFASALLLSIVYRVTKSSDEAAPSPTAATPSEVSEPPKRADTPPDKPHQQSKSTLDEFEDRVLEYVEKEAARKRPPPKLEEPTFREKVDKVTFSLGGGGVHVGYNFSVLEEGPKEPFDFGGFKPVRLYVENGKLYADVAVYGGHARAPIELRHNELIARPLNWDRNSSQAALEIVNENQVPVFQLMYKTPSHIVCNGVFPFPGGLILANDEGMVINPTLPVTFRMKRIFKYPSWKYPGQYEE